MYLLSVDLVQKRKLWCTVNVEGPSSVCALKLHALGLTNVYKAFAVSEYQSARRLLSMRCRHETLSIIIARANCNGRLILFGIHNADG